jgi:GAF domain-containing protein
MTDRFTLAADALSRLGEDDGDLSVPILEALPVDGASVSTMGDLLSSETVSATDDIVARLDELQFDLGEGPCWDALAARRPVLAGDIRRLPRSRWPHLLPPLLEEDVAAVFAFPLLLGPLRLGAIDLYSVKAGDLAAEDAEGTTALAAIVSRHVLRRALRQSGIEDAGQSRFSRRTVHQATGMVIAQLGVSAEDARLLIQGHAFAENRPMKDVATDIVERRLSFAVSRSTIEDTR